MTSQDKARVEKHKDSIEESLGFKFRMSNGFFIYKDSYFKTLWRMLAFGLEDTGNPDIVDTLSVVNRPLSCVSAVMERERDADIEDYPEYAWFKEARNAGLQEKTIDDNGRRIATKPFVLSGVSISIGNTIIAVKSSTGITCGAIVFKDGMKTRKILPYDDLLPVGYIDSRVPIRFVSALTSRTYSTTKKMSYVDTKMLPMIKNGILVGVLRRFISSPSNEVVFSKLIATNPTLIKVKTFTINGHTPAQLLTKHFDSLSERMTKDIIGSIIEFYGGGGRALPKCWQSVVVSENIKVEASPKQRSVLHTIMGTIFKQESGFDLTLRDTGTDTVYRYTNTNKKKDIGKILAAMRMYPSIKDILRKIPVLAQYSGLESILDAKTAVSAHPEGHTYKTGRNKVWIDYDAGILGGTMEKSSSTSLSRLLSPSLSNKRKLLKRRYDRIGKLLADKDDMRECILYFVAIEICVVMKIPFKIRFSRGTQYTRGAIISALSSQAYMPVQVHMVDPLETKVTETSIVYGEESVVQEYPRAVIFDDYRPDISLSTDIPSDSDRSITNATRGATVVSQHAYMISEVFREIASEHENATDANNRISDFEGVMSVCREVFSSLFEEI